MAILKLSALLRLGRPLYFLFVVLAVFSVGTSILKTIEAVNDSEVRLSLYSESPNMFTSLYEMKRGFEDGRAGKQTPLRGIQTPFKSSRSGFELTQDSTHPVLRYQEPSAVKRVALLYLGGMSDYFSLAWLTLFGVGSWLLWKLLLDVTPAMPFTLANAARLQWLGLLVLGLTLLQELAYLVVRALVPPFQSAGLPEPLGHYVELNTEFTLPGWEVGLVLLIIGAVYQRGVELQQEAELTV
ncbi:DUF2975 domain-containing protein [Hymenobacter sp. HSC-4F20]|uniref:DUF2975 domain-containing protein n=1 Tax=Hymenobacter sp. HSC-4F20 TaxID=2864135 RepID=UPI001C72D435|nr:DUF2975 domain-containing protein [Hymenobacter sp. HSC-4F20]MBX0291306.1 DUF2975 domain-containing protein [Hymenobacter sp. HSC-4F20]